MLTRPPFLAGVSLLPGRIPSEHSDGQEYPFNLPGVQHLLNEDLELNPGITFFVGENGSGKSTLLEAMAIAWGLPAEGGSRNLAIQTRETATSLLAGALLLERGGKRADDAFFLRADSFYQYATEIDRNHHDTRWYGGRSLHEQSHGEGFFNLFMNRFFGGGMYFLDEPEAALSPMRQMAILVRFQQLLATGSQFVIATHSPILMAYPNATILQFDGTGIHRVRLEETEHFYITERFLSDREGMLARLLSTG